MKRCFLALDISKQTRSELEHACSQLKRVRDSKAKVRIVPAENLHVTIKFLGPTPDSSIEDLVTELSSVAFAAAHFDADVTLAGAGAFPDPSRPKILFAEIQAGASATHSLIHAVEKVVTLLGFAPETRPTTPHVTLARIRGATREGPYTDWIQSQSGVTYGKVETANLVLYESHLDSQGARYEPLASIPIEVSRR